MWLCHRSRDTSSIFVNVNAGNRRMLCFYPFNYVVRCATLCSQDVELATERKSLKNQHEAFFSFSAHKRFISAFPSTLPALFCQKKKAIWTQAQSKAGLNSNTLNPKSKEREYNLHVVYKIYKCFMK